MNAWMARPELALAAVLTVTLCWVVLAYWLKVHPVGDEVGERLDALAVAGVTEVPRADRFARFATRNYSGDRGPVPTGPAPVVLRWSTFIVPRWTDFYAETVERLGRDPLAGGS